MNRRRVFSLLALLALTHSLDARDKGMANAWPDVWGDLALNIYAHGERIAPNGVEFEPIFMAGVDFNIGLLPRKKLYAFADAEFWAQRASAGVTNKNLGGYDFSKRELDVNAGLAWNIFSSFELRGSFETLSNLNRGTARSSPSGFQNGGEIEARYYFSSANIYDIGRLSFIGVGYYPAHEFIGGDGFEFRAGLFAQAYGTYSIPALRSYLYGNARLIGRESEALRIISVDAGIATRPFSHLQNLEFRVGDEVTTDVDADTTRNLIYAAIRAYYGPANSNDEHATNRLHERTGSPEIWGDLGLTIYATGNRMAPNGVAFHPIFTPDFKINVGLLPKKKLYLFLESEFWTQRASSGVANEPENKNFSEREFDIAAGIAWNIFDRFELRTSAYALNNLNRGGSEAKTVSQTLPSGYQDGIQLEGRYYLSSDNAYDIGSLSFLGIGYYPSQSLIGGDGVGFHPGFFAHAYGSYDLPAVRAYLYGDGKLIGQKQDKLRLVIIDTGVAARPFPRFDNLEFRLGNEVTADLQADTTRDLTYGAVRLNFSTH